jgi:hypothetical protein
MNILLSDMMNITNERMVNVKEALRKGTTNRLYITKNIDKTAVNVDNRTKKLRLS